jgi:hypothetical protein
MTTLTKYQTALVEAGRTQVAFPIEGDYFKSIAGLEDTAFNTLVQDYNDAEDAIDADPDDTWGTREDNGTYRIGSAPGRPKPGTR